METTFGEPCENPDHDFERPGSASDQKGSASDQKGSSACYQNITQNEKRDSCIMDQDIGFFSFIGRNYISGEIVWLVFDSPYIE